MRMRQFTKLMTRTAVAVLLVVGAVAAAPGAAQASGIPVDGGTGGFHKCQPVGAAVGGYIAGECVDLTFFINSAGSSALRGWGEGFCETTGGALRQCAGIELGVTFTDVTTGKTLSVAGLTDCGSRYGAAACPSDRFVLDTSGVYFTCDVYKVSVLVAAYLPVSASYQLADFSFQSAYASCN